MNREATIVTGAAGELGQAMSSHLALSGAEVWMVDVDETALTEASARLSRAGHDIQFHVLDVSSSDDVGDFYLRFDRHGSMLRGLVNNAAIYPATPFADLSVQEYDRVVAVNQRGYFLMAKGAVARMSEGAAIVNVTSITTSGGWANLSAYVQTKSAAIGLTRSLAREIGPRGIRVNGLSPGAIPTQAERIIPDREKYNAEVLDKQSLKRRGTPQDIARVTAFLLGDDAAFITGQNIEVDGGWVMT